MRKIKKEVPRTADHLLRVVLSPEEYKEKSGDLEEAFVSVREEKGHIRARLWYWAQVMKALPACLVFRLYWSTVMFRNHFIIAKRNFIKHKGYSFINLAGLTIGMTCFLLILVWVQNELSYDRFHENKDRVFRILNKIPNGIYANSVTYALTPELQEKYGEVEETARVVPWIQSLIKYKDVGFQEDGIYLTDPGFFRIFSFKFIQGSPETALPDKHSLVLTERAAERYFGREDPLGKVLHLAEYEADFKVTGVIENIPSNSHLQFDIVSRVEWLGEDRLARWREWVAPVYVMLHEGIDAEAFNSKIAGIYAEHYTPTGDVEPFLQPLPKVYLYGTYRSQIIKKIYLFSLIAVFILLMACINFMNLSTARSAQRAREVGMRKVIGATRPLVVKQFLGEAMLFSFSSMILALCICWLLLPFFNNFTGKNISLFSSTSITALLILFGAMVMTGFTAGSYPAFYLSSFQPVHILKNRVSKNAGGLIFRKILIVFQFAISVGLILCTLIVARQLKFIQDMDVGFDRDHVVTLFNNPDLGGHYDAFKQALLSQPGILYLTSAAQQPMNVGQMITINWEGNPTNEPLGIAYTMIDYDFFKTFDMQIKQGRSFSQQYPTDEIDACILNERAVEVMGLEDPIGTRVNFGHMAIDPSLRNLHVVGVVNDFNYLSMHWESGPFIFRIYRPWHRLVFIKVDRLKIPEALASIEKTFKTYAPDYPFRYTFVDTVFNNQYASESQLNRLFNVFSLLAIIVACLGLFGLASFTAERKTKEIGIRKVLGASTSSIVALTIKDFFKWIVVANLLAWPVGYYLMTQWLKNFAYRNPIEVEVFLLTVGLTLFIAFITIIYQALKAALANPVDSLRFE